MSPLRIEARDNFYFQVYSNSKAINEGSPITIDHPPEKPRPIYTFQPNDTRQVRLFLGRGSKLRIPEVDKGVIIKTDLGFEIIVQPSLFSGPKKYSVCVHTPEASDSSEIWDQTNDGYLRNNDVIITINGGEKILLSWEE